MGNQNWFKKSGVKLQRSTIHEKLKLVHEIRGKITEKYYPRETKLGPSVYGNKAWLSF